MESFLLTDEHVKLKKTERLAPKKFKLVEMAGIELAPAFRTQGECFSKFFKFLTNPLFTICYSDLPLREV